MSPPAIVARWSGRPAWARRACAVAVALAFCMVALAAPAWAQARLALVIGNSAYATAQLANPRNDAELIARTLRQLGFEVTRLLDADQKTMRRALIDFGRRLKAADAVGVFYFAGHGVQVEGENYLIPIGAEIREEREVALEAVSATEVLRSFQTSSKRLSITILDACRNNPYAAATRSGVRGLAGMNAPSGTLVSYATAPGQVAMDGDGANSPFAEALAQSMLQSGLLVEDVFKRTRRLVLAKTGERQVPWESSSLVGDFYFRPKLGAPEPGSGPPSDPRAPVDPLLIAEVSAWKRIEASRDRRDFERHLVRFPAGIYADVARWRLQQMSASRVASPEWAWTIETPGGIRTGSVDRDSAAARLAEALSLDRPAATIADFQAAARLYDAAAEAGLPAAMHNLARLHERGLGVVRDPQRAALLYRRAAEAGFVPSLSALGALSEYGTGVPLDLAEALRLYGLAAERGDAQGMTSLGYLYAAGKGVARDPVAARRWYGAAADMEHPRALYNLALMELRGEGAPFDPGKGLALLERAAAAGHAGAMREIASVYDEGRAVRRDPRKAAEFLLDAYKAGSEAAREDLSRRAEGWRYSTRRDLQTLLKTRGFYSGPNHGLIDRATRTALDAWARS